jgi:hypothetical protein
MLVAFVEEVGNINAKKSQLPLRTWKPDYVSCKYGGTGNYLLKEREPAKL